MDMPLFIDHLDELRLPKVVYGKKLCHENETNAEESIC